MRRWIPTTLTYTLILCLLGVITFVVYASVNANNAYQWTGFAADPLPTGAVATPVVVYEQNKDLWDWLQLLLVPAVLLLGGAWLTQRESRYALELQGRREKAAQRLEDQRIEEARRIEDERVQDAALQAYLDQMTELLLHESLLTSQPEDPVRTVARARTLTVARQLDGARKARVLQFLYEAGLIGGDRERPAIVDLRGADFHHAILKGLRFRDAKLKGIRLTGADFTDADFDSADLQDAILDGAIFRGAFLQWADLCHASLVGADFQFAYVEGLKAFSQHRFDAVGWDETF